MKNTLKISSLALLALVNFSCSTDSDMTTETQQAALAKSSVDNTNPTDRWTTIKTTVLVESQTANELFPFEPVTIPSRPSSIGIIYGNVRLHLDLQRDGNLVLYASPVKWDGPEYPKTPVLWATNTVNTVDGNNGPYLSAQTDGNLVLYKKAPYNAENAVWATNTVAGNVTNPRFKLQIVQKKEAITGHSEYYATFILEGNNSERHEIVVTNITDIYNGYKS
ncbi:hypothetical protein [Chryseobacterium sp. PMSZPI]|uniref:hypothetical protein n=1 Tax=Chryseobacterium sp. PMSZPI TaxID=1033900 RepID=UPI000C346CE4|nr:hypothetical protein [Chryseobacterium sp. PMSZPI]PKF74921.1 hypothetical protein CW752_06830 [Chryseobacterium sp. PMSZPI]